MAELPDERPRFFHGWVIVGAAFAVMFVSFGTAYSFAAFFHALRDEFQATRGDVSLVFAITGFLYFSLGAFSGPVADRLGPRRVILAGVVLIAAGLALASAAQHLWQIYLTYSLCVGVGVGFTYVPSVGTVQRWFSRRRGFASGLAVAGIGAGTLVIPLLAAWVISGWGWRAAYLVLAALTLVVGVPAAWFIEHSPARRGLAADGDAPAVPGEAGEAGSAVLAPGFSVSEAVRERVFWLLYAATFATGIGLFIPFVHLAPYARDHGLPDGFGTLLIGFIGAGSTFGRLFLGGFADRIGRRAALVCVYCVMGLSLLGWLAARDGWSLVTFALVFGTAYGGFVALVPALTTDYFGGRNAGGIIGVLYTAAGVGALFGPTLAGAMYDARDSYTIPILLAAATNAVAAGCIILLPSVDTWRRGRESAPRIGTTDRPNEPARQQ